MKNSYFRLAFFFFFLLTGFSHRLVAQTTGIYESYLILNLNGGGNTFYDLNAATGNTDFQGSYLGSFTTSQTLVLAGAQNKTFKCSGGNVTGGNLYYRVYGTQATAGSFSSGIGMGFVSNDAGGCGGNQTWQVNTNTTNLISGLTPGFYTLEVYTDAPGSPSTAFANNGGANYKGTFAVTGAFQDLFGRATLSPGGTPSSTYTNTVVGTATAGINGSSFLEVAGGTTSGVSFTTVPTSAFTAGYNSTLSSNTAAMITWTFNIRWNRASSNNPAPPLQWSVWPSGDTGWYQCNCFNGGQRVRRCLW